SAIQMRVEAAGGRVIPLDGADRSAGRRLAAAVTVGSHMAVTDPASPHQPRLSWPEMNDVVVSLVRLARGQPVVLLVEAAQAMEADLATLVDELADGRRPTAVVALVTGPGPDVATLTAKA